MQLSSSQNDPSFDNSVRFDIFVGGIRNIELGDGRNYLAGSCHTGRNLQNDKAYVQVLLIGKNKRVLKALLFFFETDIMQISMVQKRRSNLYVSGSEFPFNISRSKIDLFLECPQCFYLDRKLGISRPDMPGWSLNSAVDILLKNEFDSFRDQKKPHSLMSTYNIDAIPFWHPDLHIWRDDINKKVGASIFHKPTNFNVCGIIDDIWQDNKTQDLHIVDYKSTSTNGEVSLDGEYKEGYKRQMAIYQWIFRKLGFKVSNVGYFVYANGIKHQGKIFNDRLEFKTTILPYQADDSWVEPAILEIKKCLDSNKIPEASSNCKYCGYRKLIVDEKLKIQSGLL